MNLIIDASLSEPPTESLYFRFMTLAAHKEIGLDCLIETEQQMKDNYYRYLSRQGLMDFVKQIITPKECVTGLRLGERVKNAPAIKLKSIRAENVISLIGLIKGNIYGID